MSEAIDPPVDPALLPPMIAPARTALVVVDVQVDFISPEGAAGQWGMDLSVFEPPLARVEALMAAARAAGVTVVPIRVVTRPETDSNALKLFHQRKGYPADSLTICRAGTEGADYYRITVQPGDIEIQKTLYSAFAGSDLDAQLRARGIDTLVVVGFTTECCVDSTVRDAFHRDYSIFLVTDACAAYEEHLHRGALAALSKSYAMLTDTAAVLAAWR
jgi:nicotinamidase-related amidase